MYRERIGFVLLSIFISVPLYSQVLFNCSENMDEQYGIGSHITRGDYSLRALTMEKLSEAGVSYVRSDVDLGTVYREQGSFDTTVYDNIISSSDNHGVKFLALLGKETEDGKLCWDSMRAYKRYARELAQRYRGKVEYWEFLGELNALKDYSKYLRILRKVYRSIKSADKNAKVLFAATSEYDAPFLAYNYKKKSGSFFDIMTLHTYSYEPEHLMESLTQLHNDMVKYGWDDKPVWITETGYSTYENENKFMKEVVPEAICQVGKNPKDCVIGIVEAPNNHIPMMPHYDELYSAFRNVKYLRLADLRYINAKEIPVLVPSAGEYFPITYKDFLLNYLKQGGTMILPKGIPFGYGEYNEGRYVANSYYGDFHIGILCYWDEEARSKGATDVPNNCYPAKGFPVSYSWDGGSARYFTNQNLHEGDEMIPITMDGNNKFQGCVAVLYKLRSDLTGNIIAQSRMSTIYCRTEDEQASRLSRTHLISFALGVDKVFWYNLRASEFSPIEKEDHFGILHKDFSNKKAFVAYKNLISMCPSGSTRPVLEIKGKNYNAAWTRPDGKRIKAYWTVDFPYELQIVLMSKSQFYDNYGKPIDVVNGKVTISSSAVYEVFGN